MKSECDWVGVRSIFLDVDANREWNDAHQNRRIVVKARNVLCSFVEIERMRERGQ